MDFFDNLALSLIADVETSTVTGVTPTQGFLLIQQRITERLVILADADNAAAIDDGLGEANVTEPAEAGVTG